jgi:dihydrodipicolinate synthase/N-acetylneuraminate lyase
MVIPAHPLALTPQRNLDEKHQRALTRYYHAAGAGGLAVGVHTTQFEIRNPKFGLYQPVLELASETITACDQQTGRKTVKIAGIIGLTEQAVNEASLAREIGYHLGLLSLAALKEASVDELVKHCQLVAKEIPLIGFYLQPAVGGRLLPYSFWQRFVEIPNVVAIKIAPFNRYYTIDVVRAVAESGRASEISLYTGNDDHILLDLVSTYEIVTSNGPEKIGFNGGLLGHWACWTRRAVEQLACSKELREKVQIPAEYLSLANQVTDCNAAFFDTANQFAGCIPGIHEVLRRQGLMAGLESLNPAECLSLGQVEEIDRVHKSYPHLNDDGFVEEHLHEWLN